jgi:hypothetical protein
MIKKFNIFEAKKAKESKISNWNLSKDDIEDIFLGYTDMSGSKFKIDMNDHSININIGSSKIKSTDFIESFKIDVNLRKEALNCIERLKSTIDGEILNFSYSNGSISITIRSNDEKNPIPISFGDCFKKSLEEMEELIVLKYYNNQWIFESICDINIYSNRNELTILNHGSEISIVTILDIKGYHNGEMDKEDLEYDNPTIHFKDKVETFIDSPLYLKYKGVHPITHFLIGDEVVKCDLYKKNKKFKKMIDEEFLIYSSTAFFICE